MAQKDKFRTPAMERAAGLSVLWTAFEVEEGGQADKAAALGYIKAIFENVPFSWPNIMSGVYLDIDKEIQRKLKVGSPVKGIAATSPASPIRGSQNGDGNGERAAEADLEDSDEALHSDAATPVETPKPKKHHRTLAGKGGKAVIANVRMLDPQNWRPFNAGSAASYLGVSFDVLNERQTKARETDLGKSGRELSAEVRKAIVTKSTDPATRKRKRDQKPIETAPPSIFGKLLEDEKGIYLITPVPTKVTAGANKIPFTPRIEVPAIVANCTTIVDVVPTDYQPSRALQPPPQKLQEAQKAGELNVYFVPWATESDTLSVE